MLVPGTRCNVKMVDFGSGAMVDGKLQKLTGTPLYMSPEQLVFMQQFQQTKELPNTDFDPYASDVYSLGMTFLHVALMEPPIKVLIERRETSIAEYLNRLATRYQNIAQVLQTMLNDVPANRGSFKYYQDYLSSLLQPQAAQVETPSQPVPDAYMQGSDPGLDPSLAYSGTSCHEETGPAMEEQQALDSSSQGFTNQGGYYYPADYHQPDEEMGFGSTPQGPSYDVSLLSGMQLPEEKKIEYMNWLCAEDLSVNLATKLGFIYTNNLGDKLEVQINLPCCECGQAAEGCIDSSMICSEHWPLCFPHQEAHPKDCRPL